MTTTTAIANKTFVLSYMVSYPVEVYVERPENITKDELIESVTYDEVFVARDGSAAYYSLKDAWRDNEAVVYSADEEGDCDFEEVVFADA